MDSIVERMARAMSEVAGFDEDERALWPEFIRSAQAALSALQGSGWVVVRADVLEPFGALNLPDDWVDRHGKARALDDDAPVQMIIHQPDAYWPMWEGSLSLGDFRAMLSASPKLEGEG